MNNFTFDNTAQVKEQAKTIVLPFESGNQKFIFKKGAVVSSSSLSPHRISGKVIDRYKQNGFAYYVVRPKKGIPVVMREKDLLA